MTKSGIMIVALCAALMGAGAQTVYAQMTDDQVVNYVRSGMAAGKGEKQIGTELLARGVTEAQLMRIKEKYDKANETSVTSLAVSGGAIRRQSATENIADGGNIEQVMVEEADRAMDSGRSSIYGHSVFNGRALTFEPNENIATPQDYKLGPGDEVIIEIWGFNEANIRATISPEGKINVTQIGPIYLNGLTIKEAQTKIKKALLSKYSNIGGERPNSDVSVTLGQIRTIQVNVMGEVSVPGTYRLSSFATVFTAIYRAGGVSNDGSLRAIRVIRGGKDFASVDVYGYLFDGKSDSDIRLQEGDIIIVPPYENLVTVTGSVKRPMAYELKAGETLQTLIDYAGGFSSSAYKEKINVVRNIGSERKIITLKGSDAASMAMADGDVVTIGSTLDRYDNRVEIKGCVFFPGMFELNSQISSVKQLVESAGGLKEDAFLTRAVLIREKEDLTLETKTVELGAIMSGKAEDIRLRKNDVLVISSKFEVKDRGIFTINGYVARPGTFAFAENTTVEDLILQAGGLLDGASLSKVDVARRVVDPYSLEVKEEIGETFSFSIKDGLAVDGADKFYLEPYDVVSVRKSPAYQTQKFVTVGGEVAFPGQYVLQTNGERLSSIIERAGGVTYLGFVKGSKLTRRMSEEEMRTDQTTLENERRNIQRQKEKLALSQGISANVTASDLEMLEISSTYTVAVDFEKAIANPGSIYDIIVREGDVLFIPENVGTVAIKGEVLFPNTVAFVEKKPVSYYISQAGGYNNDAKQSKVYVVYMNGSVAKGASATVEPGCEIVVPRKPERKAMSTGEIMTLGTSTASLATMIVSLVNLLSR